MKANKNDLHESGRPLTQEEFINKIKTDDEFAKKWGELGPIYGKQWRNWTKFEDESKEHNEWYISSEPIDQIQNSIDLLKTNPDSRRLMVNAWNVGELDQMVLPPCHYGFQVYTRELSHQERSDLKNSPPYKYGKPANDRLIDKRLLDSNNVPKRAISLMWNQRSVDTPLGLPFNITSYALLLEIIAKLTNMVPDELIGNLGDCHIYLNQIDGVKEQLTRESFELPKLSISEKLDIIFKKYRGENIINNINSPDYGYFNELDNVINNININDFILENYKFHPTIKFPLSN